jgi:creatinine amidohydrolase/Fe(II)-dependent formamide hydrolase-like protein
MPLHRAEELTYSQVRRFDRARAIAFQPVSALEVHGPHLPLGMDWFMARWMAEETARRSPTATRNGPWWRCRRSRSAPTSCRSADR